MGLRVLMKIICNILLLYIASVAAVWLEEKHLIFV